MVGQKVTLSFGFKDNTAKEGHFGRDEVTQMQRRALCRLG